MSTWNSTPWNTVAWGAGGTAVTTGTALGVLVSDAYRIAGISKWVGVTPSPDMFDEAGPIFNRLMGLWSTDGFKVFTTRIDAIPMVSGKKTYTIGGPGLGADFDMARPNYYVKANIIFPTSPQIFHDLNILQDWQWGALGLQDLPGAPSWSIYPDGSYPVSTLYVIAQPPAGYQLQLYTWQPLPRAQAITDIITLPDGYEQGIVYAMAEELAARNPALANMSPAAVEKAKRARVAIARLNEQAPRFRQGGNGGPLYRGWLDGGIR